MNRILTGAFIACFAACTAPAGYEEKPGPGQSWPAAASSAQRDGGKKITCLPGLAVQCACTDGSLGAQRCADDGQSFEDDCVCDGDRGPSEETASRAHPGPLDAGVPLGADAQHDARVLEQEPDVRALPLATDAAASSAPPGPAVDPPEPDAGDLEPPSRGDVGVRFAARCDPVAAGEMFCESITACDAVLALSGRHVVEARDETTRQRLYLSQYLCDVANSESAYNSMRQGAAGGGIGFASFHFNANGSYAQQEASFQAWQQEHCENEINQASAEAVLSAFQVLDDPSPVASAWLECCRVVADAQLSCLAAQRPVQQDLALIIDREAVPGGVFTLQVRWCSGGDFVVPQVRVDSFALVGATCNPLPDQILAPGAVLDIGELSLLCVRDRSGQEVFATLNVTAEAGGARRSYVATAALSSLCGGVEQPACRDSGCGFGLVLAPDLNRCCPDFVQNVHWHRDEDGDGYGDAASEVLACAAPTGYVPDARDCDDSAGETHPRATETCDRVDNDCDGSVDEGLDVGRACQAGVGACLARGEIICDEQGHAACSAHPSAPGPEVCNGRDDDCDGRTDENAREEVANGLDDDCDGRTDEGLPPVSILLYDNDSNDDGVCPEANVPGRGRTVRITPADGACHPLHDGNDMAAKVGFEVNAACRPGDYVMLYRNGTCTDDGRSLMVVLECGRNTYFDLHCTQPRIDDAISSVRVYSQTLGSRR